MVAGTRPEAVKLSSLINWLDKLRIDFLFIWSGQHYDYQLSEIFFKELVTGIPLSSVDIKVHYHDSTNRHKCFSTANITWYQEPVSILAKVDFGGITRES